MGWINAFDAGSNLVQVSINGNAHFTDILGKGQSSAPFDGLLTGEKLSVNVSSEGSVSLVHDDTTPGPSAGWKLLISPSDYDFSQYVGFRVAEITIDKDSDTGNFAFRDIGDSVGLPLSGSGSTWTPDPADITSLQSTGTMGIQQGVSV